MKKNSGKSRQVIAGGGSRGTSSSSTFNSNNVIKIEMAGDELETVEIEEVDENDCDLKANSIIESADNKSKKEKTSNVDSGDSSDEDEDSLEAIKTRLERGCDCTNSCFNDIDPEDVYKHRLNIAELTKNEHDMYLMGITMGCIANCKTTYRQNERQRHRALYVYRGKRICLDAFLFLENVTLYQIKRIRNHVLTHGVTPIVHGNVGKKAHNAFSLDIYVNLEKFLKTFLKYYVLDLNKAQTIQGISRSDVYYSYKEHGRKPHEKLMGYSTFRHFMKKQFPMIKFRRHESTSTANSIMMKNIINKGQALEKRKIRKRSGTKKEMANTSKKMNILLLNVKKKLSQNKSKNLCTTKTTTDLEISQTEKQS